jgi:hypothetical protein
MTLIDSTCIDHDMFQKTASSKNKVARQLDHGQEHPHHHGRYMLPAGWKLRRRPLGPGCDLRDA